MLVIGLGAKMRSEHVRSRWMLVQGKLEGTVHHYGAVFEISCLHVHHQSTLDQLQMDAAHAGCLWKGSTMRSMCPTVSLSRPSLSYFLLRPTLFIILYCRLPQTRPSTPPHNLKYIPSRQQRRKHHHNLSLPFHNNHEIEPHFEPFEGLMYEDILYTRRGYKARGMCLEVRRGCSARLDAETTEEGEGFFLRAVSIEEKYGRKRGKNVPVYPLLNTKNSTTAAPGAR
jgi:hypothetical protein